MPEYAFLALGSNRGDRAAYLARARRALAALPQTDYVAESTVEETDPIGPEQPAYLNQMVLVHTDLSPHALLRHAHRIEDAEGRQRQERWGPRTLDIDLVRYGDLHVDDDTLRVPHPELDKRAFWQRELQELMTYVG